MTSPPGPPVPAAGPDCEGTALYAGRTPKNPGDCIAAPRGAPADDVGHAPPTTQTGRSHAPSGKQPGTVLQLAARERSDEALLDAVANGDRVAFSQLYDRVSGNIYGVVLRVLRDRARSEEVAQDVLLEIWRTAVRFDTTRAKAGTWMMLIAHRRAIDRVRYEQASRARDHRVALRDRLTAFDEVSEAVEARDEHRRVGRMLERLTELQREAIVLAYYDGHTYREVAEILDVPLGTIKTRIRDGLERLRDVLRERDCEEAEVSDRTSEDRAEEAAVEKVAGIARELAAAETLDETLQRIVDLGADYIEPCDAASISFIQGRAITTPVWSHRTAYDADQAQYRHGQGPCLQAIAVHETIVIDDLTEEQRWPKWREAVLDFDVRSTMSFRLFLVSDGEETFGGLNMYSSRPHAFGAHAQALGQVFASHAAVALKAAITDAGLEQAIRSRDIIGQARGILMERDHLSADDALQVLRRTSHDRGITISTLAEQVTESGALPV